jgi:DMSO/TMAO reductase YedYZ heme-binding membrane subunit
VVVYLLALFSIPALQRRLGRTYWTVLRTVGMTYIAYAFAHDFVLSAPFGGDTTHVLMYAPFAILSVAGPVLCALSFAPSLRRYFLQSKSG